MVNRELTLSTKLWRAQQHIERLGAEIKQRQLALEKWQIYMGALKRVQELEDAKDNT